MNAAIHRFASGSALAVLGLACPSVAQTVPAATAVETLLAEMDRCFGRRDLDGFLACFQPVHVERHARFAQRLEQVFAFGVELTRASAVQSDWVLGSHRVSLVRAETRSARDPDRDPLVEHALMASQRTQAGETRATAWIEVDAAILGVLAAGGTGGEPPHTLRCHACNYHIDAGDDWLMVPNVKDRIGCLESLSFYSLDTDLVADLTIHLARAQTAPPARRWLRDIAMAQCRDVDPEMLPIERWTPPAYGPDMPAPALLDGARCEVPAGVPGQGASVYLAVYGRLGYLISVHGRKAALEQRVSEEVGSTVDRLLTSFTLLDSDLDPTQLEVRILEERMGSNLDGVAFTNSRFDLSFPGIDGWDTRLDAGAYAFDATWSCPRQSGRFRLRGLEPPRGYSRWTPEAADMVLAPMLRELELFEARTRSEWIRMPDEPKSDGFRWRLDLENHDGKRAGARHHALTVRLAEDLMVVTDAESDSADEIRILKRSDGELKRGR